MLKITDADWLSDYKLELVFSDGFAGTVDLAEIFQAPAFQVVTDFKRFALTAEGHLDWGEVQLTATTVRDITEGDFTHAPEQSDLQQMEEVIKQAAWDSIQEGRPDILQAAIRAYVEQFGHKQVVERAGIKSRTSAYRSLKPEVSPNFGTLVQLGHAVVEIAQEQQSQTVSS